MADTVKKNTAWAVMPEVTEGTYVAPAAATDYVQTLVDGAEMNPSKEVLERNIFTSSIGKTSPLTGQFQVNGAVPVEARANSTAGGAPEFNNLIKSAMGNRRQITTTITSKSSGNTASVIQIEDADISKIAVGDMVMIKMSGAYHVSPITAVDATEGAANITLLVAHPSGDITDSAVIEKATTYYLADSGHQALSISKFIENSITEKATGCKVTSMSLENFATGQIPSFNFGFEGLDFDRTTDDIPHTPSYSTAIPPIVLDGRAYMDGSALVINELTFQMENTLGFKTSVAASNGRVSSRAVERTISGSIDPYKQDDSIANFTKYRNNTAFSLFAYAKVPTGTSGEFGQVVAVYMPNCIITEMGEGDKDGLLQDSITFSANRGTSGTTPELYISFI